MLTRLFCDIDDFCQVFLPVWEQQRLENGIKYRKRPRSLSHSKVMTLLVHFDQIGFRTFKHFYQKYAAAHLKSYFPKLPSYQRFVEYIPDILIPLTAFMQSRCKTHRTIAFVDSTPLRVCKNLRIPRHKTFKLQAGRGKSSTGWFYGFKLHLVADDEGNIVSFSLSSGNTDDRKPVRQLLKAYTGKLFGDRGYISKKLKAELAEKGINFITTLKSNMKPQVLEAFDKALLRKRSIIETINDQLKNISQIEHSRHRSLTNCMVNVVAGLLAYSYQDKKPSLNLQEMAVLPV